MANGALKTMLIFNNVVDTTLEEESKGKNQGRPRECGSSGCHNQKRSKCQGKKKVKCYHCEKQKYMKKKYWHYKGGVENHEREKINFHVWIPNS